MEDGLSIEWKGNQYRLVVIMNDGGCVGTSLRLGDPDPFDGDAGNGIFFDPEFYSIRIHGPDWDASRYSNEIFRIHLSYWLLMAGFVAPPAICLAWIRLRAKKFREEPVQHLP
jgi:hypothetical protein